MKTRKIISVYLSGFLVGVALVLFPAAGNLFVDTIYHGFTSAQYGSIYLPQIILAIISSLLAPRIADKIGIKRVMLYGLASLGLSMALMISSNWYLSGNLDYVLIMLATAFLGAGFGFTITALNPLAYQLFPGKETSAVTAMHIMLGLGTASSALLLNYFLEQNIWWMAPALVGSIVLVMFLFTLPLSLGLENSASNNEPTSSKIPKRLWFYILVVFLYGACEATLGNFGAVFLEKDGGLSLAKASIGLSLFWGGITVGRVLFTFIALKFKTNTLYSIAPFLVALVFFLLPSADNEILLLSAMFIGGLGLSFLFPKSISAATEEFPKHAALISGALVASIQLGTGFSSNVIGILNKDYPLNTILQYSAVYAVLLALMIGYLTISRKKNTN